MAVRVRRPFSFDHNGVPVTLAAGRLFADDHPYVKAHPTQFDPADVAARTATPTQVETATAEPGARRTVTRGPKAHREQAAADGAPATS